MSQHRFPTLHPGMHVRLRHRKGCILPSGLNHGDEVTVKRLDGFVIVVRNEDGKDYPVSIDNIVCPNFVFVNGKWVPAEGPRETESDNPTEQAV